MRCSYSTCACAGPRGAVWPWSWQRRASPSLDLTVAHLDLVEPLLSRRRHGKGSASCTRACAVRAVWPQAASGRATCLQVPSLGASCCGGQSAVTASPMPMLAVAVTAWRRRVGALTREREEHERGACTTLSHGYDMKQLGKVHHDHITTSLSHTPAQTLSMRICDATFTCCATQCTSCLAPGRPARVPPVPSQQFHTRRIRTLTS